MSNFGERLKYLRNQENLSQSELAQKLGIAKSTISMYEVCKREPDFKTLESIADFFKVDMNYLYGRTQDKDKFIDADIRRIQRARQNMPDNDKELMMEFLERSFREYFKDDDSSDDQD